MTSQRRLGPVASGGGRHAQDHHASPIGSRGSRRAGVLPHTSPLVSRSGGSSTKAIQVLMLHDDGSCTRPSARRRASRASHFRMPREPANSGPRARRPYPPLHGAPRLTPCPLTTFQPPRSGSPCAQPAPPGAYCQRSIRGRMDLPRAEEAASVKHSVPEVPVRCGRQ